MRTPASVAGHPIHPMLVTIPIGLWAFSLVCDLIRVFGGTDPAWSTVALYCIGGGIIGALLAAIPGFIDLLSLPAGLMRRTALYHMAINLTVVVLFVINLWMRASTPQSLGGALWLSIIGIGLLLISGWLGGKMVYTLGVAVDTTTDAMRR